jgi:chromosome segregation ATPase
MLPAQNPDSTRPEGSESPQKGAAVSGVPPAPQEANLPRLVVSIDEVAELHTELLRLKGEVASLQRQGEGLRAQIEKRDRDLRSLSDSFEAQRREFMAHAAKNSERATSAVKPGVNCRPLELSCR